jgi:hypothetical protein
MRGDIAQDRWGGFFRDNGDGSYDALSEGDRALKVNTVDRPVVLVRDGAATGDGDPLAARVAVALARQYA